MTLTPSVAIIGAGPAGLTAAYQLCKANAAVTVLEADPIYVGGISRTANTRVSCSTSAAIASSPSRRRSSICGMKFCPTICSNGRGCRASIYRGKFYAYPLKAFEALLNLGVFESACMASFGLRQALPGGEGAHLPRVGAQPVRRTAVPDFLQDLHREGVGHVVRRDLRRLGGAAHQGPRLLPPSSRAQTLAASAASPSRRDIVKTLIESFHYPRHGPGMMWERRRARSRPRRPLLMGRELVSLNRRGRQSLAHEVATTKGERESFTARHVVSSAPVRELVPRIEPMPISLLHARALRYRDFLTVALMVRKARAVRRQLDLHPRPER